MRPCRLVLFCFLVLGSAIVLAFAGSSRRASTAAPAPGPVATYLGFDLNIYPGDDALPILRRTFSFTGYWLGPPPGEKRSNWQGKRELLASQGFGFVVLFNGRDTRNLRNSMGCPATRCADAQAAVQLARHEGFAHGTVIFLDIEEGGRLPASYHEPACLVRRTESIRISAGCHCSAMPSDEGGARRSPPRRIFKRTSVRAPWFSGSITMRVHQRPDVCSRKHRRPPSWRLGRRPWVGQYAQSPRRKEYSAKCAATYASNGTATRRAIPRTNGFWT